MSSESMSRTSGGRGFSSSFCRCLSRAAPAVAADDEVVALGDDWRLRGLDAEVAQHGDDMLGDAERAPVGPAAGYA